MPPIGHSQLDQDSHRWGRRSRRFGLRKAVLPWFLVCRVGKTIHLYFHQFPSCVLVPFIEYVIRHFVTWTELFNGDAIRLCLRLVLEIESFQIFAAVHNRMFKIQRRRHFFLIWALIWVLTFKVPHRSIALRLCRHSGREIILYSIIQLFNELIFILSLLKKSISHPTNYYTYNLQ